MIMQLLHNHGGQMKMGSSSSDHAAAVLSFMQLQHDQVLLIYTSITSHLAMEYMSGTLVLVTMP